MIFITEEEIKKRVKELATEIYNVYKDQEELYFIFTLNGSFIFAADLSRELGKLGLTLKIGNYKLRTYGNGVFRIVNAIPTKLFDFSLKNKPILLVDDIYDRGNTLRKIYNTIVEQEPYSISICVLLDKDVKKDYEMFIGFTGFKIPNKFVIGYGLDYNELGREFNYITEKFSCPKCGSILKEHYVPELHGGDMEFWLECPKCGEIDFSELYINQL